MLNDQKNKICSFYESRKRMPTYSEMMKLLGFKSKNAVFRLVEKLIEADIVGKDHLGRLVPTKSFDEVPLLGTVKAGIPDSAEEILLETVNLGEVLAPHKESTYILEVDGDSMIDAHIMDGDWAVVEKTNHAKDGQIVIAEVDGEFTMKYYKENGGTVWLEPANKKYKPIYPTESFKIIALVKSVIRQF